MKKLPTEGIQHIIGPKVFNRKNGQYLVVGLGTGFNVCPVVEDINEKPVCLQVELGHISLPSSVKEALNKSHGFDEAFFMYGEETDYCYRLNKLGIKSIYDLKEITYIGFTSVIFNIFKIRNKIKETVNKIIEFDPDILLTVGKLAKNAQSNSNNFALSLHFNDNFSLFEKLNELLTDGDIVLIKGSRSMQLDQLINELKNVK